MEQGLQFEAGAKAGRGLYQDRGKQAKLIRETTCTALLTTQLWVQGEGASKAAQGNTRRLVLTSAALLERRSDTYEVAERRHLAQVAALVRFIDQPQWLAIEWTDGARPTMYITPARDALLTALLDAAQVD